MNGGSLQGFLMPLFDLKGVGYSIITECGLGFYSESCFILPFYQEYYLDIELPNQMTVE